MTESLKDPNELYESINLDLLNLIQNKEPLTFLVGAGISREYPSCLPLAWEMIETIVKFGAIPDTIEDILNIKDLRFEYIIQHFRDIYDRNLSLYEYLDEYKTPNIIHIFLADMIKSGHYVLTTSFDYLLEYSIGVSEKGLRVVITKEDFTQFGNPEENIKSNLLCIYKIHGSLRNITDESNNHNTKQSLITTLDAFTKEKKDNIFKVEDYKQEFFECACQDRSLIIMGYSGGDNFDIVPSLIHIKGIKRIIMISHDIERKDPESTKIFRLKPITFSNIKNYNLSVKNDELLVRIKALTNVEIIKIITHTGSFISRLVGVPFNDKQCNDKKFFMKWLNNHFELPTTSQKYTFSGHIFLFYSYFIQARSCLKRAIKLCKSVNDPIGLAQNLIALGNLEITTGKPQVALKFQKDAYNIFLTLEDPDGISVSLCNIANVYRNLGELDQSIQLFNESNKILWKLSDFQGLAANFANMGLCYLNMGIPKKAILHNKAAYRIEKNLGNLVGMAIDLDNIGLSYYMMENYIKAKKYFDESLKIKNRLGLIDGIATTMGHLGLIQSSNEEYESALKSYQRALNLHEGLNQLKHVGENLGNIGIIFKNLGELEKAMEYFSKAQKTHEEINWKPGLANDFFNLAQISLKMNLFELALDQTSKAIVLFQELENIEGVGNCFTLNVIIYINLKNYKMALEWSEKAYQNHAQITNFKKMEVELNNIVHLSGRLGDIKKSLKYAYLLLELYEELNSREGRARCYEALGIIYKESNEYDKALKNFNLALELQKELNNKSRIAIDYLNISVVHRKMKNFDIALNYTDKSKKIYEDIGDTEGIVEVENQAKYIKKLKINSNESKEIKYVKLNSVFEDQVRDWKQKFEKKKNFSNKELKDLEKKYKELKRRIENDSN